MLNAIGVVAFMLPPIMPLNHPPDKSQVPFVAKGTSSPVLLKSPKPPKSPSPPDPRPGFIGASGSLDPGVGVIGVKRSCGTDPPSAESAGGVRGSVAPGIGVIGVVVVAGGGI